MQTGPSMSRCGFTATSGCQSACTHHRVRQLRVEQVDGDAAKDELEDRHESIGHRLQLSDIAAQGLRRQETGEYEWLAIDTAG